MWPTLLEVEGQYGAFTLNSYGLLVLIGFASATAYVLLRAASTGLPLERLPLAALAAAAGGFFGAKLLDAIVEGDLSKLAGLSSGLAWYGGVIGGGVAVIASAGPLGLPVWKLADATAPALALGAGIGRLGCFFAGCCHGVPVPSAEAVPLLTEGALKGQLWQVQGFPWLATSFEGGAASILGVPLYPTQLWQSGGSFVLLGVLLWVSQRRRFDGQVIGLWLVLDPLLRAFVEGFRGDARGYAISWEGTAPSWFPGMGAARAEGLVGLTTSQGLGLALAAMGVAILVLRRNAGVAPEIVVDAYTDDLVG